MLGGTWESYPHAYQEAFVRDLFYAANTFYVREKRPRLSLEEEQTRNESSDVKIIGLTLETRPDTIGPEELQRLRKYGCTRVQLGIQHTDDAILKKINRQCTTADSIRAIRLLKDAGFKVDIHLMPNLPGSSPERDLAMFDQVLSDPGLQCDQWKIYPCEITPWTVIKVGPARDRRLRAARNKLSFLTFPDPYDLPQFSPPQQWFDSGKFTPYSDEELIEVLIETKAKVHPWIRLNRVVRDIPSQYILGGINAPSLRGAIQTLMKKRGLACRCIRCREVGSDKAAIEEV